MQLSDGVTRLQIGAWQFELDSGRMTCGRQTARLQPRVRDVLVLLVERQGRVVSKEELFQKVWKGVAVTENALAQTISVLRAVFAEDKTLRIETLPTLGYRFLGSVSLTQDVGDALPEIAPDATARAKSAAGLGGLSPAAPGSDNSLEILSQSSFVARKPAIELAGLVSQISIWKFAGWAFLLALIGRMLFFGHGSHPH